MVLSKSKRLKESFSILYLEEDHPQGPDVGLEAHLDPRLGGLGEHAVLVLEVQILSIPNPSKCIST